MNITPEQIPDEVVEAAFDAMRLAEARQFGDVKTPNNGARHECMRAALAAALPVLLVQVGYQETQVVSDELIEMDIWHWVPNQPIPESSHGIKREPVYIIKETPNAHP